MNVPMTSQLLNSFLYLPLPRELLTNLCKFMVSLSRYIIPMYP